MLSTSASKVVQLAGVLMLVYALVTGNFVFGLMGCIAIFFALALEE